MGDQHTQGTKVWLADSELGWVQGDVLKVEKDLLHVRTERGNVKELKPDDCPLQNPGGRGGVEVSCQVFPDLNLHAVRATSLPPRPQVHQMSRLHRAWVASGVSSLSCIRGTQAQHAKLA